MKTHIHVHVEIETETEEFANDVAQEIADTLLRQAMEFDYVSVGAQWETEEQPQATTKLAGVEADAAS